MDSKMYFILIIIWLMYLPRGKKFLYKEISSYFFVILHNGDKTLKIFLKNAAKISTRLCMPKMNKLLKQNANILLWNFLFFILSFSHFHYFDKKQHMFCCVTLCLRTLDFPWYMLGTIWPIVMTKLINSKWRLASHL